MPRRRPAPRPRSGGRGATGRVAALLFPSLIVRTWHRRPYALTRRPQGHYTAPGRACHKERRGRGPGGAERPAARGPGRCRRGAAGHALRLGRGGAGARGPARDRLRRGRPRWLIGDTRGKGVPAARLASVAL